MEDWEVLEVKGKKKESGGEYSEGIICTYKYFKEEF